MPFLSPEKLTAIPELLFVLGIMVIVHEFGHFLAAKLCGVRVESFAVGFGKRLFGFVHNGTDYRLNLVPLGGYVKMAGEMGPTGEFAPDNFDPPKRPNDTDPGELQNHPRWQRTLITIAGPLANFLLAFLLMTGVYMAHNEIPHYLSQPAVADYVLPGSPAARTGIQRGDQVVFFEKTANPSWEDVDLRAHLTLNQNTPFSYLHNGHRVDTSIFLSSKDDSDAFPLETDGLVPVEQPGPVTIAFISNDPDLPAARAGLKPGDQIVSVDGLQLHSTSAIASHLKDGNGKPAQLQIARKAADGSTTTIPMTIIPQQGVTRSGGNAWQIGFQATDPPFDVEHYGLARAARESWTFTRSNSLLLVEVLQGLVTRQISVKTVSSPIGMGVQVHQAFQTGRWVPVVLLMAIISLNLGVFNLLPIPILDGGTVLFLAVESLIRRDINPRLKERFYQVAFVCIVLFAAVVIFNDISKIAHIKS